MKDAHTPERDSRQDAHYKYDVGRALHHVIADVLAHTADDECERDS
jgi:hypothetical protein